MKATLILISLFAFALSNTVFDSCSGSVLDDPVFKGFHGQRFVFNGQPGGIYSIFNDESTNLNAKFAKSSHDDHKHGTIMKSIGILIGKTPIVLNADDRNSTFVEIEISGERTKISERQHITTDDCIDLSYGGRRLIIETEKYQFTVFFEAGKNAHISVNYLNVLISYPIESEDKVRGVLGQTANENGIISTIEEDFTVSSLLASDSKTGKYNMALAPATSCDFSAPDPKAQARDAHLMIKGVDCSYPTPSNPTSFTGLSSPDGSPLGPPVAPNKRAAPPVYYIPNSINTITGFSFLSNSVQLSDITFTSTITSTSALPANFEPFKNGPFFDLSTNNIYFQRDHSTDDTEFKVQFTLNWKYGSPASDEVLTLFVQFCKTGNGRCAGSIMPVPKAIDRVHYRGERCSTIDNVDAPYFNPFAACTNDANGRLICQSDYKCATNGGDGLLSYCSAGLVSGARSDPTYDGVCTLATSGCVLGDTPVLMADGTSKPIKDIKRGQLIMGSNGQPAYVSGVGNRTLGEGRLISINNSPHFATPDHPFEDASDPTKMLVVELGLAITLVPEQASQLKQMQVGDYISAWDAASHKYKPTLVESITVENYPTDTIVYAMLSYPIVPSIDYVFAGFTVYGYSTSPLYYHTTAEASSALFSVYVAMKVKSTVDAAFSKQTAVTDKLTFYGIISAAMKDDVNTYIDRHIPLSVPEDSLTLFPHLNEWAAGTKQVLYQLEVFNIASPNNGVLGQVMPRVIKMDLTGLFTYGFSDALSFVDNDMVQFVNNWISTHYATK